MKVSGCLWPPAPANPVLSADELHVWCACLDQPQARLAELSETLSEDEKTRARSFHFERDRKHFTAGRGILRAILSSYLGLEPKAIEFRYGERGKPAMAKAAGGLSFNLSHSHGL